MAIVPGLGTVLSYSLDNGVTYTSVAQRVTIGGPSMSNGEASTSHLDSTVESNRPTLLDNGELSLTCWYDPGDTTHQEMFILLGAGTIVKWKLAFASGSPHGYVFQGWVKAFAPQGMDKDSNLGFDATIRATGLITSS
jgi:Lambda phage tail tube protein, TTP